MGIQELAEKQRTCSSKVFEAVLKANPTMNNVHAADLASRIGKKKMLIANERYQGKCTSQRAHPNSDECTWFLVSQKCMLLGVSQRYAWLGTFRVLRHCLNSEGQASQMVSEFCVVLVPILLNMENWFSIQVENLKYVLQLAARVRNASVFCLAIHIFGTSFHQIDHTKADQYKENSCLRYNIGRLFSQSLECGLDLYKLLRDSRDALEVSFFVWSRIEKNLNVAVITRSQRFPCGALWSMIHFTHL